MRETNPKTNLNIVAPFDDDSSTLAAEELSRMEALTAWAGEPRNAQMMAQVEQLLDRQMELDRVIHGRNAEETMARALPFDQKVKLCAEYKVKSDQFRLPSTPLGFEFVTVDQDGKVHNVDATAGLGSYHVPYVCSASQPADGQFPDGEFPAGCRCRET